MADDPRLGTIVGSSGSPFTDYSHVLPGPLGIVLEKQKIERNNI